MAKMITDYPLVKREIDSICSHFPDGRVVLYSADRDLDTIRTPYVIVSPIFNRTAADGKSKAYFLKVTITVVTVAVMDDEFFIENGYSRPASPIRLDTNVYELVYSKTFSMPIS